MIPQTELTNRQPNLDEFTTKLAEKLNIPDSIALHTLAANWAHWEYSAAANNPFDTEQGYIGATDYNSVGVKNYQSVDDGVAATVETMTNGLYPNLIPCLEQIGTPAVNAHWLQQLIGSLNVWGTGNSTVSFPWTQDMNANQQKYLESFSVPGLFDSSSPAPQPAPSGPVIDATLETRVTVLEQKLAALQADHAALNRAVLAREHAQAEAADTFAHDLDVAADPSVIPPSP